MSGAAPAECVTAGSLTVCLPPRNVVRRAVLWCPICKARRRSVVRWMGAWYGQARTCVACGDSWMDGELRERPFRRSWRKEAIAKARKEWDGAMTPGEYEAFTREDVRLAIEPTTGGVTA